MNGMNQMTETTETFDVIFVGAGMSGIGGAFHLKTRSPDQSFVVLDAEADFGGTWWTHRYPGIRSDSELYTYGFRFKPWMGAPIATAQQIRNYMGEVIEDGGLGPHIRYRHRITHASWSSRTARWTVSGVRGESSEPFSMAARFLWMGAGYYRHDQGYLPEWPAIEDFGGRLIHPQQWPEDLALQGRQVLVIGSGATAATLVPAIAERCAHVTMLQRSPTYFLPMPNSNELADLLRSLEVPSEWVHEIVRRKVLKDQREIVRRSFEEPESLRRDLLAGVRAHVGSAEVVEQHFTPSYLPWRQRLALVPDGDFFSAMRAGKVSVVTDKIERFEQNGVRLASGALQPADIVIAATGLELQLMGGIDFSVDGRPMDITRSIIYRGAMLTGVPNLLWVFGYFRSSWTLRVDLLGDLFNRLLALMKQKNASIVTPFLRPQDATMEILPWIDPENFNPGYLMRAAHKMPRQGSRAPWRNTQDYWLDAEELPQADLEDGALVFTAGGEAA